MGESSVHRPEVQVVFFEAAILQVFPQAEVEDDSLWLVGVRRRR